MSTEPQPLAGKTIALPETRELDLLSQMVERLGATTVRCPLVAILDAPDSAPVEAWLQRLIAGEFAILVFYTGEGIRRLIGLAQRIGIDQQVVQALASARKVTRGPKPAKALRELNLAPDLPAKAPTTQGLIDTFRELDVAGTTIGVQLFAPDQTMELIDYLRGAGARVETVAPYVYAPKSDDERVIALIKQLEAGAIDVVAFTSAAQVDRLWEVASDRSLLDSLKAGLAKTRVAAVGPVVAKALEDRGVNVPIVPDESFFMKPLVNAIVAALAGR